MTSNTGKVRSTKHQRGQIGSLFQSVVLNAPMNRRNPKRQCTENITPLTDSTTALIDAALADSAAFVATNRVIYKNNTILLGLDIFECNRTQDPKRAKDTVLILAFTSVQS
mmetsp:Transcript_544/g.1077  ORF Transcript_544/g.1077 Transcript_544/m.1077 type:complete len:111 (-) Transcript_544:575-907(-)